MEDKTEIEETSEQKKIKWNKRMIEKSMISNGLVFTSKCLIKQLLKGCISEEEYILRTRLLFENYEQKKEEMTNDWNM